MIIKRFRHYTSHGDVTSTSVCRATLTAWCQWFSVRTTERRDNGNETLAANSAAGVVGPETKQVKPSTPLFLRQLDGGYHRAAPWAVVQPTAAAAFQVDALGFKFGMPFGFSGAASATWGIRKCGA
jgi:hypothetical protein